MTNNKPIKPVKKKSDNANIKKLKKIKHNHNINLYLTTFDNLRSIV